MKRDFVNELKQICNQDKTRPTIEREQAGRHYNIHKRSLPPGIPPTDKIVFMGLTKKQATRLIETVLKPKVFHQQEEDRDGQLIEYKTLVYFEPLPENATPQERNVFHNHYDKPVSTWGD